MVGFHNIQMGLNYIYIWCIGPGLDFCFGSMAKLYINEEPKEKKKERRRIEEGDETKEDNRC